MADVRRNKKTERALVITTFRSIFFEISFFFHWFVLNQIRNFIEVPSEEVFLHLVHCVADSHKKQKTDRISK